MQKVIYAGLTALLTVLPFAATAADYSRFEGRYVGSWDDTYDTCGDTAQDGDLIVNLKTILSTGKITSATVKFDDDTRILASGGKIFRRNGVRRIRLEYGGAGEDYVIKARLTDKRKIIGNYEHEYAGCSWGGTANLKHS